jgi:hypothetical protein
MTARVFRTYCGSYRWPPDGVSFRQWGAACDRIGRGCWQRGQPIDYAEVERLAREGNMTECSAWYYDGNQGTQ